MKNVIFVVIDELIASGLGCTGNPVVQTPQIDRLARSGMRFKEAYCATPLCTPSRISMFTGQYTHTHQRFFVDEASHIGAEVPTMISLLKENGYKTALIGKNHCFDQSFLDRWFDQVEEYHHWGKTRGEIRPSDQQVYDWRHSDPRPRFASFTQQKGGNTALGKLGGKAVLGEGLIETPEPFPPEQCMTARIAEDAENFLATIGDQPFFLKYSFPDPHWPITACEPYYSMYSEDAIEELPGVDEVDWTTHPFRHFIQSQAAGMKEASISERKRVLAIYYGMISFIDESVGRLLRSLEANGLTEDTLILFTADHGCFAGHFGLNGKTGGFYDSLIRIPLILAGSEIEAGTVSESMISNIDFMPTILDLLNLPIPESVQGRSFQHLLKDPNLPHREEIFVECGTPTLPPKAFPYDDYDQVDKKRTAETGWFWFVDYTTKGRCASIKRDGWKYCYYAHDTEELYHVEVDPHEITNLAEASEWQVLKDQMKSRLMDWLLHEPYEVAWRTRNQS